ncbi:ABC transporter ATP-binding protein [Faecalibacterium sp. An192]|uniref:amino acid ABC transporter ATP-binding/permease protein n=1 Tax=Faecalibacterium sp. An192 TaxID=1965581 RepID=UPI0019D131E8|nr:ABC transporter ATP-binding protein [Faecalibacterium sp. An192]
MKRSGIQVMAKLVGLVRPLTGYMSLAVVLGLLGHLCATAITVFGGFALLNALGVEQHLSLPMLFLLIGLCALLRGALRYGEQTCNHFIAFKLLALLRDRVFAALRRLCPAKLEGKNKGNLISVITSDIELLEVFYAHTISPICIAALYTALVTAFLWSYHPVLGVLALLAHGIVGILIPWLTSRWSGDVGQQVRSQSGQLSGFVLDSLRGLSETLQYGQGQTRRQELEHRGAQLSRQEEKAKRISGRNSAITNTVILLFDFIMLYAAATLCGFSAALIATLTLMSSFGPSVALAALGSTLQNTFAAGNRVLDLLEEQPVVEDVRGYAPVAFDGAAVSDLSFSYNEEEILSHMDLEIPKGKIVGILGRSGSGKSTLLKLLMRFWQAEQGEIRISDRPIQNINTENLRNMESYVTQETYLFHDTIANNLRIAKLDATQAELEEACRKASVHDFIVSLPQGYDTPVAELGDSLSGGERQRLGLARAFLHQAPLLLLDEPTSNLDSLNEAVILRSLQQVKGEQTIVLVSHRQSTMGIVEQQYCVEQGRMS